MHLRAVMPPPKMGRGQMDVRIARKVAALCGIAGDPLLSDDAGRGRAWLTDYQQLTTTEIILGGPIIQHEDPPDGGLFYRPPGRTRHFRHRDGDIDYLPIPNAAVQRYVPDTKAALVLSGANRVLEAVTNAIRIALDDVCHQVNSPGLVVAVGLCLLQEVFAAQPILVRNGVQAAQIQRALLRLPRPEPRRPNLYGRPLAKIERARTDDRTHPEHLEVIRATWESVVARDLYSESGKLRTDTEPKLRFKPASGYEQNDTVASTGQPENREWGIGRLEELTEALLTGSFPGAPVSTILIEDPPFANPYAEVVVPRQRQVEHLVANVVSRLGPLVAGGDPRSGDWSGAPHQSISKGQVLALPSLDLARWAESDELTRRAVLLGHYYAVRAAGWFAGMTELDYRRNREDCATRCNELASAAERLLNPDDLLRDQLCAHCWGYLAQYDASFERHPDHTRLTGALERLLRRVDEGTGGKAVLVELLPQVLESLRTVRRALNIGPSTDPPTARLTADLKRWWKVADRLRDELIDSDDERHHLDYGYANMLLDEASSDEDLLDGLTRMEQVINSRKASAQHEGRWIGLGMSYLAQLRGLTEALHRWPDGPEAARHAYRAYELVTELTRREETWTYLNQRTDPKQPGRASYDGNALMFLSTLAQGWLAVRQYASLTSEEDASALLASDRVVSELQGYLAVLRDPPDPEPGDRPGSRLDPFRERLAEKALVGWSAWRSAGAR